MNNILRMIERLFLRAIIFRLINLVINNGINGFSKIGSKFRSGGHKEASKDGGQAKPGRIKLPVTEANSPSETPEGSLNETAQMPKMQESTPRNSSIIEY